MADAKNTTTVGGGALFSTPDRPVVEVDESNKVTKYFPRPVKLTLQDFTSRNFAAGVQEIPAQFADDPWLKANGMTDVPQSGPLPPLMMSAQPGSHAHARTVMSGTGVYDATLVPSTTLGDSELTAAQEHAQMAAEAVRQAEENLAAAQRVHVSATENAAQVAARVEEQRNNPRTLAEEQERQQSSRQIGGSADQETPQERAAREKREREAKARKDEDDKRDAAAKARKDEDDKIVAGLSAKEKAEYEKMDDAAKAKFLDSKRKAV